MRRVRLLIAGTAIVVTSIAIGDASPTAADHGIRALATRLTGAAEFPGPGDPDGVGAAGVVVNVNRARVCYVLAVKHIAEATLAHIHVGAAGTAPPNNIVVHLTAPTRGFSADCVSVDEQLARDIASMPANYYVNVHNADFPAGAIRGQLG